MRKLKPVTPGELLLEEFLMPMEISQYRLAKKSACRRSASTILWQPNRPLLPTPTDGYAVFGLSNGYWLRAQAADDTEVAERTLGPKLAKIKPWARSKILEVAS